MKAVVKIDQLVFSWDGHLPCIQIPAFELSHAEALFIKGPSGSGKSTFLNLLGGVLMPSNGDVTVLGHRYDDLSSSALDRFRADHIGFIFQQFNLLPYLSVIENICLTCRFSARRRQRALAQFTTLELGAVDLLERLGLTDERLYKRSVIELSVGQQQRVSAARALLGAPEIIIADEPTSALDPKSREQFLDLLLSQCNEMGSALIFVSHDSSLQHHFHRILELSSHEDGGFSL
ncbi:MULTISPECIES: ABC transporter ATP-binding protein [unclassified Neptuniibacter]|uniref:ABC transporter ATP-binding protein n=1 Tax=unclassified Neptuniibacter TaxID=2630693 RepID=UPI000C65FBCA|nr:MULTISPECIES: ABC transporter ATP-binding protein [unclassified Neptuniibacter]MAY40902.1 methionine ABC transporter ATP-binding protein [Oceanospirillaceae bacterium]|tara:strand:+ start:61 stop:762 length:702 start_codon:yes stop_codon:yes gene_type:complete